MKLSSLLYGLTVGVTLFLALPFVLVQANDIFRLPVFGHYFLQPVGVIFIVVGGGLFSYCSGIFAVVGRGSPVPIDPPEVLITSGAYRYTRNPMHLSYLAIFLGEFLFLGHLALLLYFLAMCIFIPVFVIKVEEPELKKRFGQKYVDYTKKVPRFLFR